MKTVSIALLLLALLAGCSTTADKLNDVRIGMTKDQVIALLGKADSMSAQANIEYLTYYLSTDSDSFNRERAYSVRLVDGKVESFGRFMQLFDIYNRPVTGAAPMMGASTMMGTSPLTGPTQVIRVPASNDIASQITRLKKLKDEGTLTEEEFQKAKEKVISEAR
ncbi:MAG TPA: SHOCT domain-containing protein [Lacunisphaera sp.]|jgi:hypothetical protein